MCRSRTHRLLAYIALLILPAPVLAAPAIFDPCIECHGDDGMGDGKVMVPVLAGIPAGHIQEAIFAYVDGARRCVREPRMCETVAALSESEVAEVAEYYAGKPRGSSREAFDKDLAAEGALLHKRHCSRCHVSPDDEDVAEAVGIPLHGQRSEYLRFAIEAYLTGYRESLVEAMAEEIEKLVPGDLGVLVNYYSSYRPEE